WLGDGWHRLRACWWFRFWVTAGLVGAAIDLGIADQRARKSTSVSPSASPITKPTPYPTPSASGGPYPLLPPGSMHMINASTGWAAGSGTDRILRTVDGGSHWDDAGPRGAQPGNWIAFFLDA